MKNRSRSKISDSPAPKRSDRALPNSSSAFASIFSKRTNRELMLARTSTGLGGVLLTKGSSSF